MIFADYRENHEQAQKVEESDNVFSIKEMIENREKNRTPKQQHHTLEKDIPYYENPVKRSPLEQQFDNFRTFDARNYLHNGGTQKKTNVVRNCI